MAPNGRWLAHQPNYPACKRQAIDLHAHLYTLGAHRSFKSTVASCRHARERVGGACVHGGPKPHHVHGTVGARGDEQPPPQWDGHLRQQAPPLDESQARRWVYQPRARGRAGARWLGTLALLMGEGSVGNWGWVVGSAAFRRLFQRPGRLFWGARWAKSASPPQPGPISYCKRTKRTNLIQTRVPHAHGPFWQSMPSDAGADGK